MARSTEDLLAQGQRIWEMLDELSAINPEGYKKFIDKQMSEGIASLKPPQPVRVFCCRTTSGTALYVNICSWQQVPKPKSDKDPIPVKGGTKRKLKKKPFKKWKNSNEVFDLAFHPTVLQECLKKSQLEHMLIELCMDYIEQQAGISLVRKSWQMCKEGFIGPKEQITLSLNEQYKLPATGDSEGKDEIKLPSSTKGDIGLDPAGPPKTSTTANLTDALFNIKLDDTKNSKETGSNSPDLPPSCQSSVNEQTSTKAQKKAPLIQEVGGETEVVPEYSVEVEGGTIRLTIQLPLVERVGDVDLEIEGVSGSLVITAHNSRLFYIRQLTTKCYYILAIVSVY